MAAVHREATGAVLVGHGLAGELVRAFAVTHPDQAVGLATIGAPPPGHEPAWLAEVGQWRADRSFIPDVGALLHRAYPGGSAELADLHWDQRPLEGAPPEGDPTGSEPRVAIVCEDDAVVSMADQLTAARLLRAPTASVPGGHSPHVRHPGLVATLLVNWLTPGDPLRP